MKRIKSKSPSDRRSQSEQVPARRRQSSVPIRDRLTNPAIEKLHQELSSTKLQAVDWTTNTFEKFKNDLPLQHLGNLVKEIEITQEKIQGKKGVTSRKRPNTNKAILKAKNPELLKKQDEFLQKEVADRRQNYPAKKFLPLTVIPTWQQLGPELAKAQHESEKNTSQCIRDALFTFNSTINEKVSLFQGDMILIESDALVLPTDDKMNIDEKIQSAAGSELTAESEVLVADDTGPKAVGDAIATCGYALPAYYCIHVHSPTKEDQHGLRQSYKNCLDCLLMLKQRTIVLPCIGTEGTKYPRALACQAALDTTRVWLNENFDKVDRIVFCTFDSEDWETYKRFMPVYFPIDHETNTVTVEDLLHLNHLQQKIKQNMFHYCTLLNLRKAHHVVSDLLFWLLRQALTESRNLVELICTGCTYLTDASAINIACLFPNLHEVTLDGCKQITECGMNAILKTSSLTKASFKGCNICLLPQTWAKILARRPKPNIFLDGSPVALGLGDELTSGNVMEFPEQTSVKIIVVREHHDKRILQLFAPKGNTTVHAEWNGFVRVVQQTEANGTTTVVECDMVQENKNHIPKPKVIPTQELLCAVQKYSRGCTVLLMTEDEPTVISNQVQEVTTQVQQMVERCVRDRLQDLNWCDQLNASYMYNLLDYLRSNHVNIVKMNSKAVLSTGDIKTYKHFLEKDTFLTVSRKYLDACRAKAKENRIGKMDVKQRSGFFALSCLGEIALIPGSDWFVSDWAYFESILSKLVTATNMDSTSTKPKIPWMPDDASVFSMDCFTNENILENTKDFLQALCVNASAFVPVMQTWLNETSSQPACVIACRLPWQPPVPLEAVWPDIVPPNTIQQCWQYSFPTRSPQAFLFKLFSKLCQYSTTVMMWADGVLANYGCVEVLIMRQSGDPTIVSTSLRTLKLQVTTSFASRNLCLALEQATKFLKILIADCLVQLQLGTSISNPGNGDNATNIGMMHIVHDDDFCTNCEHSLENVLGLRDRFCSRCFTSLTIDTNALHCKQCLQCAACLDWYQDQKGRFLRSSAVVPSNNLNQRTLACDRCTGTFDTSRSLLVHKYFCKRQPVDRLQEELPLCEGIFYQMRSAPFLLKFQPQVPFNGKIRMQLLNLPEFIYFAYVTNDTELDRFPLSLVAVNGQAISIESGFHSGGHVLVFRNVSDSSIIFCSKELVPNSKTTLVLVFTKAGASLLVESESIKPEVSVLFVNMRLELASYRASRFGIATIIGFEEDGQLRLGFDRTTMAALWSRPITSEDLHPIGYCQHMNLTLQFSHPTMYATTFDWTEYLAETNSLPIPAEFFFGRVNKKCPKLFENFVANLNTTNAWIPGMKLEARDRQYSNKNVHGPVSIADVYANGKVKVTFDGWSAGYDYVTEISSPDLHPCGHGEHVGNKIWAPKGYEKVFEWSNYLRETQAVPAPFETFTKNQTQGCPKHECHNLFNIDDSPKAEPSSHMLTWSPIILKANGCLGAALLPEATIPVLLPAILTDTTIRYTSRSSAHKWNATRKDTSHFHFHWLCNYYSDVNRTGLLKALQDNVDYNRLVFPLTEVFLMRLAQAFSYVAHEPIVVPIEEYSIKTLPALKQLLFDHDSGSKENVANGSSSTETFMLALGPFLLNNLRVVLRKQILVADDHRELIFRACKNTPTFLIAEGLYRYMLLLYHTWFTCWSSYQDTIIDQELNINDDTIPSLTTKVVWDQLVTQFERQLGSKTCVHEVHTYSKNLETVRLFGRTDYRGHSGSASSWNEYAAELTNLCALFVTVEQEKPHLEAMLTSLSSFRALQVLYMERMGLEEFEFDAGNLVNTLKTLNLSGNPLRRFPSTILRLKNLQVLRLQCCGLTSLPDNIGLLGRLRELDVGMNMLHGLPDNIQQLTNLVELNLCGIPLFLPRTESVTKAEVVKHLQDHFVQLPQSKKKSKKPKNKILAFSVAAMDSSYSDTTLAEDLDEALKKYGFENLEATPIDNADGLLRLNQFLLAVEPRFTSAAAIKPIFSVYTLRSLNLSWQLLPEMPADVGQLKQLRGLNLSENWLLQSLNASLGLLDLTDLNLNGCHALQTPPQEVVRRGEKTVLAYLKRLLAGSQACRRTKLMMVGLGGAGKTSLVKALLSGNYSTVETGAKQVITDGIDVVDWVVKTDHGLTDRHGKDVQAQTITYNIWDFAGQAVYYNTHQFFLSNRAIYFLLWNTRLGYEHAGLDFWLSSISCHARKAPIFIVGTHADQVRMVDLPKEELRKTYPQIVNYFPYISSITGVGVQELAHELFAVTLKEQYIGEEIPTVYVDLDRKLTEFRKSEQLVAYTEVQKIALQLGLTSKAETNEALTFLHDLGCIQYFNKEFLREWVIVNSQWLVNAMACLISVKESVVKHGRFSRNSIASIWSDFPVKYHQWLLRLTEEFDLTFALPNEDVNIVPCMLPEELSEFEWPASENESIRELKIVYKFDYLPIGLFNRSQTRLCHYSDTFAVWKKGSLLKKNQHTALVHQNRDRELIIQAKGPKPENVIFLIHEVIDTLIREYFTGLKYDVLIPCVDCVRDRSQNPHMFPVQQIKRALRMKVPFLQCTTNFHIAALGALQEFVPPVTPADFETHLNAIMQDLKQLRQPIETDLLILCNLNDATIVERIAGDLKCEGLENSILVCDSQKSDKTTTVEAAAAKLCECCAVVVCISENFCADKQCFNMLNYVIGTCHRPIVPTILIEGDLWKQTPVGMLVGSDLYVDMSRKERYQHKLKELVARLKAKLTASVQSNETISYGIKRKAHSVFFSYCWKNSQEAVNRGTEEVKSALGPTDPREIARFLKKNGIDCWLDIECAKEGVLFEEIAEALRQAKVMVVCVSDQYVQAPNCMLEFRFASGILKLPIILCGVGIETGWQSSEIAMCAFDAPRIYFHAEQKQQDNLSCLLTEVQKRINANLGGTRKATDHQLKSVESATITSHAYEELSELAQRKFLQQVTLCAAQLRAQVVTGDPQPRLFYIDIVQEIPQQSTVDDPLMRITSASSRKRTRPTTALSKGVGLANLEVSDLCICVLCEHEGGFHTMQQRFPLQLNDTLKQESVYNILATCAPYLAPLYTFLKYSKQTPAILLQGDANTDTLMELKRLAKGDFEAAYSLVSSLARMSATNSVQWDLQRCSLHTRRVVWLCSEHRKTARDVLSNDTLDPDEITLRERDARVTLGVSEPVLPESKHEDAKTETMETNDPSTEKIRQKSVQIEQHEATPTVECPRPSELTKTHKIKTKVCVIV